MMKEKVKELIRERKIEEIIYLLENNIIHCKDVYNAINNEREILFDKFYKEEIDIRLLDANMKYLNYIEKEIKENYHDFSDKFKTITLNRKEWIYYKN